MIGDILRKERERQRMTIQEIEDGTSIRASYIEAIESGEYDKMPGRVYAKGFIKNYANFLNLNGEEIVKQFMSEVAPPAEIVEQAKDVTPSESKPKSFSVSGRRLEDVGSNFSSNHLVAAIIAIAVLVGGFFYFKGGTEVAQSEVTKPQEVQQVQPTSAPTETVVTTPASAAPAPAPKVDGVNLQATFSDDCWMLVTVDGNVVYEGVITAGQVMDWKGNNNVNVRVGNAGAVDFVMNGQSFGKLGGEGDVVDRDFTR